MCGPRCMDGVCMKKKCQTSDFAKTGKQIFKNGRATDLIYVTVGRKLVRFFFKASYRL